jgi:hypothetical protein
MKDGAVVTESWGNWIFAPQLAPTGYWIDVRKMPREGIL